ncbi:unnamed protein product [Symbiodinium sp. CCMP2592]|nr:unnamed protein product [Symbiodinium sp. CCMP2592]
MVFFAALTPRAAPTFGNFVTSGVASGKQPKGKRVPPLVSEYKSIITERTYGIAWTPEEFVKQESPADLARERTATLRRWMLTSEEAASRADPSDMPDHCAAVLGKKSMKVFKSLLTEAEYPDTTLTKVSAASLTVEDVRAATPLARKAILASTREGFDREVAESVYQLTKDELAKGWLKGPFKESDIPPDAIVTRRFGIVQSSTDAKLGSIKKVRPIDDYTESLANLTNSASETICPHGVDVVVAALCLRIRPANANSAHPSMRCVDSSLRQVYHVYTDASYDDQGGGLGGLVYDFKGLCLAWFSEVVTSKDLEIINPDGKLTLIYELETLAAVLGATLIPNLRHCDIVLFVDNEASLAALIRGQSDCPFVQSLLSRLFQAEEERDLAIWFERVRSESNPADAPSRGDHSFPAFSRRRFNVQSLLTDLCGSLQGGASQGAEFQIGDAANVDTSKLKDAFNRKGVPAASSGDHVPIANDTDGMLTDSDLALQGTVELGGVNCEEEEHEAWREELYRSNGVPAIAIAEAEAAEAVGLGICLGVMSAVARAPGDRDAVAVPVRASAEASAGPLQCYSLTT